jgi:hypothetical protein
MAKANTYPDRQLLAVVGIDGVNNPGLTYAVPTYSTITGTAHTLAFSDNGQYLVFSNTANIVLTIPPDLDPLSVVIIQGNTGVITVTGGVGVDVFEPDSQFKSLKKDTMISIIQFYPNEYRMFGETQA